MKKKCIALINLITAIVLAVLMVGYAFAWLIEDGYKKDFTFGGSSGNAYFASGDGKTAETAFVITDKYHFYNLAWLQNTGRFGDTYYYFKLGDNIDELNLTGVWLPPIGNAEHPFMGDFNGNGKTIKGLQITTNKGKLTSCPILTDDDYEFSKSVGMFGMTKNKNASTVCNIHNFIMDGVIVEVAALNTQDSETPVPVKYAAVDDTSDGGAAAGLAVGHVEGKVSSIGVLADTSASSSAILDMQVLNKGYSTFNSIIGELAENATASVTGGGHAGGNEVGNNFGASLNVQSIYDRLELIGYAKYGIAPGTYTQGASLTANFNDDAWRLPKLDNASQYWTIDTSERFPFAVTSDSVYTGSAPQEYVASNNVGYLTGNTNKFGYTKEIKFADRAYPDDTGTFPTPTANTVPAWFYKMNDYVTDFGGAYSTSYYNAITQAQYDALPDGVKNLIQNDGVKHRFFAPQLSQTYQYQSNASGQPGDTGGAFWTYYGQIDWNGGSYGEGENRDGYAARVDGYFYDQSGELIDEYGYVFYRESSPRLYMPNDASWVAPIYSIDANGNAKDENGRYYDQSGAFIDANGYKYTPTGGYYPRNLSGWTTKIDAADADGYAMNSTGQYYSTNGMLLDVDGYITDTEGYYYIQKWVVDHAEFDRAGKYHDEDGYAINADGLFYDSNGYLINNGYAMTESGKYMPNQYWPLSYSSVDEYGYILDGSGNRILDYYGNEIKYDIYTVDSNNRLMIDDTTYLRTVDGNYVAPRAAGQKASIASGTKVSVEPGSYVKAKAGTQIGFNHLTSGVLLPNNAIWFKPAQPGMIRFVVFSTANTTGSDGITLVKATRTSATRSDPFHVTFTGMRETDIEYEVIIRETIPHYMLMYYEYEVTAEDIAAGNQEYIIWNLQNKQGVYFLYLDIGASSDGDLDTSSYDPTVNVSAVDFIYDGVTISTDENETTHIRVGDFVVDAATVASKYEATATSVYFEELNSALRIVYVRLHARSDRMTMYVTSTPVTTSLIQDTKGKTYINVTPA